MEKNCSIHISYIYTLNKKWSPAEFEDMSEISASMPTPSHSLGLANEVHVGKSRDMTSQSEGRL